VSPRTGLDDVETENLGPTGTGTPTLGRPTPSQYIPTALSGLPEISKVTNKGCFPTPKQQIQFFYDVN
jgi:hypothetical protein